ncbi:MAG TPA: ABC transporter substrate-binding protein [Dehalococcoidia bacterium]|nr:ABC transporter substrate-binding protein [Dehalococcoidia bacterium]
MQSRRWFRLICIGAALCAALILLAACGGDEEEESKSTPDGSATTAPAAVPELEDGVLDVGSDIAYAPIEFFEEGTQNPDGLDIDLAKALAEELGVSAKFTNTGFDGIIGGLTAQRFDILISAMTVTDERSQQIDFIPYFSAGTDILVAAGNPKSIKGIEDLSGLTVGVQIATIQVDQLQVANDDLKAAGKPEIDVLTFDQNPLAVEQLLTGRADAVIADSPIVANDARLSDGKLEALGLAIEAAPYGMGVRKGSTELKAAVEDALQTLQANGTYDEILAKWGLEGGAIN